MQLNFVRGKLVAHSGDLQSCPDLHHLARELDTWCEQELRERSRLGAVAATPVKSFRTPAKTPGTKGGFGMARSVLGARNF